LDLLGLIALCLLVIVLCVVPLMPYVAPYGITILTVLCYLLIPIGIIGFMLLVYFVRAGLKRRNTYNGHTYP
jgi:hypothetical protein